MLFLFFIVQFPFSSGIGIEVVGTNRIYGLRNNLHSEAGTTILVVMLVRGCVIDKGTA